MEDIERLVFEALGEASMCWSETPKGVFDSANAKRIGDELVKAIKEREATLIQGEIIKPLTE